MFYETKAVLLDGVFTEIGVILCDIQPFERTINFEDGIDVDVCKRAFCDVHPAVNLAGYFYVGSAFYKIMHIKAWEDYLEVRLALSERGLP